MTVDFRPKRPCCLNINSYSVLSIFNINPILGASRLQNKVFIPSSISLWRYIPAKLRLSLSMSFTFYVCCPRSGIRVWQCDIELATLEFHNARMKSDNTTLVFHATFQSRIFNFAPNIRHAQLLFYAGLSFYACFCACFTF